MESRTVAGAFGEPFWLGHKWRNAESSAEASGRTVGGQLLPWRRFICSQRRRHLSLPFGALLSWRWRRPSGAGSRELTCENPYCPLFARPLERAPGQPRAAREIEAHLRAHLNNNARAVRLRFSLGFSLGFAAVYLEFIVGVGPICAPSERETIGGLRSRRPNSAGRIIFPTEVPPARTVAARSRRREEEETQITDLCHVCSCRVHRASCLAPPANSARRLCNAAELFPAEQFSNGAEFQPLVPLSKPVVSVVARLRCATLSRATVARVAPRPPANQRRIACLLSALVISLALALFPRIHLLLSVWFRRWLTNC